MPTSPDGELTLIASAPFRVGLSGTARLAFNSTCHSTASTCTSTLQACNVDVQVDAVEWQVLLNASRAVPDSPTLNGALATNVTSPSGDVGMVFPYFAAANFSPTGSNFEQWKDDKFEAALKTLSESTDPATIQKYF